MNRELIALLGAGALLYWWTKRQQPRLTPSVVTSETYDLASAYNNPAPVQYPAGLVRTAQAIARAEGFYVAGTIPNRANNPGDLVLGGPGLGRENITQFATVGQGWDALYRQLSLIANGGSAKYWPTMTIMEMARVWTGNDNPAAWAANVAGALGVSPDAVLAEVLW